MLKIINETGFAKDTKIIDLETGENLCEKYFIKAIDIAITPDEAITGTFVIYPSQVDLTIKPDKIQLNKE